jgi:lauroyl/myristoyl acyltransferase
MSAKRPLKKLRYIFEIKLLDLAVWLLPRLPRHLLMVLSRLLGTLAYWVDKRGRTTALENLRCAFGDQYTMAQRRRIARSSYQVFARTFVDLFWSPQLTADNWRQHFDIITDAASEERARQNGAVWVTPHYGNFELISQIWGFRGFPFTDVELAKRLGLSIITGVCRPLPDGRYEAHLFEGIEPGPQENTREMTQRIWNIFEQEIRKHPECWLWMYKQWRYRPVGQHGVPHPDYPFYSNYSEALAQMVPPELLKRDVAPAAATVAAATVATAAVG